MTNQKSTGIGVSKISYQTSEALGLTGEKEMGQLKNNPFERCCSMATKYRPQNLSI